MMFSKIIKQVDTIIVSQHFELMDLIEKLLNLGTKLSLQNI